MAQDVTVAGASYSDVPSVELPKTGGGTAVFYDASVATATASEVLSGYTAFGANGLMTGTAPSGTPKILVAAMSCIYGTTYYSVTTPNGVGINQIDTNYFHFSNYNGSAICVVPGTYKVVIYARGTFNTNGNNVNVNYRLYHNSTIVKSGSYSRSGGTDIYTAAFAVGDTIDMQIAIASGSTYISGGFIVQTA